MVKYACVSELGKYFEWIITSFIKPKTNLICRQLAKVICDNHIKFWFFLHESCSVLWSFLVTVPSRQGILNKLSLEYSTFSTRKNNDLLLNIHLILFSYDSRIPFWRRFSEEEGISSWQITEAFLDKCCSWVLGPTKRVVTQLLFASKRQGWREISQRLTVTETEFTAIFNWLNPSKHLLIYRFSQG